MGLAKTVRNAVRTADRATKDLQVSVQRTRTTSLSDGGPGAVATKKFLAIWEDRVRRFVDPTSGIERASRAKATILSNADIVVGDYLERVGGTGGPVLSVDKFGDPGTTGGGFLTEVWIGSTSTGSRGI